VSVKAVSETCVRLYQTSRRHFPEDRTLYSNHLDFFISLSFIFSLLLVYVFTYSFNRLPLSNFAMPFILLYPTQNCGLPGRRALCLVDSTDFTGKRGASFFRVDTNLYSHSNYNSLSKHMYFHSTHVLLFLLSYYTMDNLLLNKFYKYLCTLPLLEAKSTFRIVAMLAVFDLRTAVLTCSYAYDTSGYQTPPFFKFYCLFYYHHKTANKRKLKQGHSINP